MVGWHHRLGGLLSKFWKLVMDRTVWRASVHRVINNQTRLSNRTELNRGLAVPHLGFPSGASGNEPACQSWRVEICWFDVWVMKIPFKKAQQHTPVFFPGESTGQRSLAGYSPQSLKESDMTETTQYAFMFLIYFIQKVLLNILRKDLVRGNNVKNINLRSEM